MEQMHEFYEVVGDPGAYARKYKEGTGKKIIGYFCSYAPEEIILAAGAHPMRLFGTKEDIALADAHFQAYCCSLVRGALEDALRGSLDYLDGTVFPHTCDSIQRLSDVWRLNTDFGFFADVVLPVKLNTESSRRYMADVLRLFRRELGEGLGREITDRDLKGAIETYNALRGYLGTIYALRSEDPGIIAGSDVYAIVKASMIMDRFALLEKLPKVIDAMKGGALRSDNGNKKRIILVGSVCDHPDIFRILEASGGVVVGDDLCSGSRYFEGAIGDDDDPIDAIAGRYIDRVICPAKHISLTARGEHVVKLVREVKADGVIFLLLKFCDPHAFDYPYMKESLDTADIPSMLLEMEDRLPGEGQLLTRFETFIHML